MITAPSLSILLKAIGISCLFPEEMQSAGMKTVGFDSRRRRSKAVWSIHTWAYYSLLVMELAGDSLHVYGWDTDLYTGDNESIIFLKVDTPSSAFCLHWKLMEIQSSVSKCLALYNTQMLTLFFLYMPKLLCSSCCRCWPTSSIVPSALGSSG